MSSYKDYHTTITQCYLIEIEITVLEQYRCLFSDKSKIMKGSCTKWSGFVVITPPLPTPQPPLNSRLRVIAANLAQLSYKMWVFRNELSNNAELFYSYN